MPAGHELTKIAIAVAISLPANQSVTIFVIKTLRMTPPAPATSRPAICQPQESDSHHGELADQHQQQRADTVALSPNLFPIAPPGNASTTPGAK